MTKEAEDHLRKWTESQEYRNSRFHGWVRELFLDWERLRDIVDSLNVPEKQEPGDRLTPEGVYE